MSNVDAPGVNADGETTNEELLVEQSGIPAMTKKFTIETNTEILGDLDVTGTVTATSFIGNLVSGESFVKFEVADPDGDSDAPSNPKLLSTGGVDLWDVEINALNDFSVDVGDDIELTAGDDVDISAAENVNITSVDYMDIISEDNIYLTAEGKIDLESDDYIELNSEVRMLGDVIMMVGDLPTTDPLNAGQLWNDLGTLKISAG
jgi:hypothetical protein